MKTVCSLITVAVVGSVASADVVSFQFAGVSRGNNVGIAVNGGSYQNVFSGSVIHNIDGQRTVTFCIDPDQYAQKGTTVFERESLADALSHRGGALAKAWAIAEMAHAAGPDIWTETADKNLASAFQIAVWEVVMDLDAEIGLSSLSLSGGAFKAQGTSNSSLSSGVSSIVNQLFGSISFDSMKLGKFEAYTNSAHQDFMTMVPAPGSMLLSLAALPLIATRRRK